MSFLISVMLLHNCKASCWFLIFFVIYPSSSLHCPRDSFFHSGFCYRVVNDELSFDMAQETCRNQGGQLAVFKSHAAQRAVFQWIKEGNMFATTRSFWIGLIYNYKQGDRMWRYIDGKVLTPWDYQDWAVKNVTTERRNLCALATTNRWLSDGCREGKYPFLCYFEAHYCDVHNVQIQNGFITDCREDGQFLHGDVVEVRCRKSYTLIGPDKISCLGNGSWSPMPTCEPGCLRPYDIPNSYPVLDKSWHRIGDTSIILCHSGYLILVDSIPRSHAILTCMSGDVWSPEKLNCIHINSSDYSYSPEIVNKVTVTIDDNIHLACPEITSATVDGAAVTPIWMKDQVEINVVTNTRARYRNDPQNVLTIDNADDGAAGIYLCLIEDIQGELHVAAYHVIVVSGEFCSMDLLVKPKDVAKFEGNHALLRCYTPDSMNFWYKDGVKIDSGSRIRILPDGSLLLQHVCYEDAGDYTCVAIKHSTKCSINATARLSVAPTTRTLCGLVTKSDNKNVTIKPQQHPWLATLWLGDEEMPFCYGTLISERWVITSTTCVYTFKKYRISNLVVKLGLVSPAGTINDTVHVYRVGHIETHPNYLWSNTENDVAMLWLIREVSFTDDIRPLCLTPAEHHENPCFREGDVHGKVSGWGPFDSHTQSRGLYLRAEALVTEEQDLCQRSVNFRLPPSLFCARSETGDKDHTHFAGDSGSPFAVFKSGRWYLHGIFTRGERYTHDGDYDYFTRTEQHADWIEPFLQKH